MDDPATPPISERIEMLKKMWLDGVSASQIANEIGNGVTRHTVGHVAVFLGLPPQPYTRQIRPVSKMQVRAAKLYLSGADAEAIFKSTGMAFKTAKNLSRFMPGRRPHTRRTNG